MNLLQYIIMRVLAMFAQVFGAIAIVFTMLKAINLDPTLFFLINSRSNNPAEQARQLAELRASLGLDIPIYMQFYHFFRNMFVEGSLGNSWSSNDPVTEVIANALPSTMITFGIAFLIYTPLSIFLGIISASKRGSNFDKLVRVLTTATYAIPSYILGLWLVFWGIDKGLAPWPRPLPEAFLDLLILSFLPIITVVLIYTGFQFRLVRAHMLEILHMDYIRTARAKGLSERVVLQKHALRNGIPFFVTSVAVTFPIAFSGVAALEVVFQIPGIGQAMVSAALGFDWPVLIGVTVVFTFFNAILLGITDILVQYLNPQLRFNNRFTPL